MSAFGARGAQFVVFMVLLSGRNVDDLVRVDRVFRGKLPNMILPSFRQFLF